MLHFSPSNAVKIALINRVMEMLAIQDIDRYEYRKSLGFEDFQVPNYISVQATVQSTSRWVEHNRYHGTSFTQRRLGAFEETTVFY